MCVCLPVGPSVPPAVSYTKRGQALSVESDHREEWDGARRLELSTSKGDVPASPLAVQERKKTPNAVGVRKQGIPNKCQHKAYEHKKRIDRLFGTHCQPVFALMLSKIPQPVLWFLPEIDKWINDTQEHICV